MPSLCDCCFWLQGIVYCSWLMLLLKRLVLIIFQLASWLVLSKSPTTKNAWLWSRFPCRRTMSFHCAVTSFFMFTQPLRQFSACRWQCMLLYQLPSYHVCLQLCFTDNGRKPKSLDRKQWVVWWSVGGSEVRIGLRRSREEAQLGEELF